MVTSVQDSHKKNVVNYVPCPSYVDEHKNIVQKLPDPNLYYIVVCNTSVIEGILFITRQLHRAFHRQAWNCMQALALLQ